MTRSVQVDFYNQDVISITAKQMDRSSRYVQIICTNQGEPVILDASAVSAVVRYRKADGLCVLNTAAVQDDGTILVELTEQMLAVSGSCYADVVVMESASEDELASMIENGTLPDASAAHILSTLNIRIHVVPNPIADAVGEIESSDNFDALNDLIAKATADYTVVMKSAQASADTATTQAQASSDSADEAAQALREMNDALSKTVGLTTGDVRDLFRFKMQDSFSVTETGSASKSLTVDMSLLAEARFDIIALVGSGIVIKIGDEMVVNSSIWSDSLSATDTIRLIAQIECRDGLWMTCYAAPVDSNITVLPAVRSGYLSSSTDRDITITATLSAASGSLQSGCEGEAWGR